MSAVKLFSAAGRFSVITQTAPARATRTVGSGMHSSGNAVDRELTDRWVEEF
jgi:hypothetical protein